MGRGDGGVYRPTYRDRHGETKVSTVWWVRFSVRGKRYSFSSGTSNKSEAVRIKRDKLAQAGRGHVAFLDAEKYGFEDLVRLVYTDHTLNNKSETCHLDYSFGKLRTFFGDSRAHEITTERLKEYAVTRRANGIAPATVNVEFAFLQRAFNLAIEVGRLYVKPKIPFLEVHNVRQGYFERPDFEAVLSHLGKNERWAQWGGFAPDAPVLRRLMRVAYITGWRCRSEIQTRQWKHVDFDGGWLRVEPQEGKTKKPKAFPLDAIPELREALHGQRLYTDEVERERGIIVPWVFHRAGKRIISVQHSWDTARKEAGIPGALVHDFKRTALRNILRAGVPVTVAMDMIGIYTFAMLKRYGITSEADMKEGGRKLAAMFQSERTQVRRIVPVKRKARG